jgi:hypothetical protein
MEHKLLYVVPIKYQVIGYYEYVNDNHIIYDQKKTNIDKT